MQFALMLTQDEAFVTYIDVAFETGQNFQYCQKTWCNGIDDEFGAAYVITGPQDETQRVASHNTYSNSLASQIDGTGGHFYAGANPDSYWNGTEFSWDWDTSDCYDSCVAHGIIPKPDYPCRCRYKTDMATGAHTGEIQNTAYFEPRGRPWYYVVPAAARVRSWTHVYMFTTGLPGLGASQPLYDAQGHYVGVQCTDIGLAPLSEALGLLAGGTAEDDIAFVLERDTGKLVAASLGVDYAYAVNSDLDADADGYGKVLQVLGTECSDAHIAAASAFFASADYVLGRVYTTHGRFLQASALDESSGTLSWLLVITQATACPAGTFEDLESVSCKECPWPATSTAGSSSCDRCDRGYFLEPDGMTCTLCPPEVVCNEPGHTIHTLPLKPKYWRSATHSIDIYECPFSEEACTGGNVTADLCAQAYGGVLCAVCQQGKWRAVCEQSVVHCLLTVALSSTRLRSNRRSLCYLQLTRHSHGSDFLWCRRRSLWFDCVVLGPCEQAIRGRVRGNFFQCSVQDLFCDVSDPWGICNSPLACAVPTAQGAPRPFKRCDRPRRALFRVRRFMCLLRVTSF